ncbi:unnamed protein product [Ambrosiozyma monospora]|uniref:Unnamed protein product n=1 Tax=Ambrosiozyma monospora TaxID=43982 RepID=A0ACB5TK49_AMBMO|nr:unnamed protein product [Ambrosiozyma monospora]
MEEKLPGKFKGNSSVPSYPHDHQSNSLAVSELLNNETNNGKPPNTSFFKACHSNYEKVKFLSYKLSDLTNTEEPVEIVEAPAETQQQQQQQRQQQRPRGRPANTESSSGQVNHTLAKLTKEEVEEKFKNGVDLSTDLVVNSVSQFDYFVKNCSNSGNTNLYNGNGNGGGIGAILNPKNVNKLKMARDLLNDILKNYEGC